MLGGCESPRRLLCGGQPYLFDVAAQGDGPGASSAARLGFKRA